MLSKIEDFGKNKGFFQYKKIGLLNSTPVQNTKTDVIDFDKTKEILYKGDRNQPKSCDALKLICEQNRLDFLELKSVENIVQYNNPIEESLEKIRFAIPRKIEGSKETMELIVSHEGLALSKEEILEYTNCSKNFYLIVDRDISQKGLLTFSFNMLFNSAFRQIESENPIIVKGLMEIDEEYQALDQ